MKLAMAGTDFRSAPLELRGRLSFGKDEIRRMTEDICKRENILGCVIVSTCNRTEIYVSFKDSIEDPTGILFEECGEEGTGFEGRMKVRYGVDAVRHLSEVACGLHSAIICEEQIVSQISGAAELSRESGGMDAVLSTLFREAVASGKRALTEHHITAVPRSAAIRAVDMAEELAGGLEGRRALVIGSGKMGCLAAKTLIERGCDVKITIRSYRSGENIIPRGAVPVEYAARLASVAESDIVISATRSPHFTLTRKSMESLPGMPLCIFDLAVPRDIEKGVGELTRCFDIDDIYSEGHKADPEIKAVYSIAESSVEEFMQWDRFRDMLPLIDDIKRAVSERVLCSAEFDAVRENGDAETAAIVAAEKAADLILKSLRDTVGSDALGLCCKRIEGGSREARRRAAAERT